MQTNNKKTRFRKLLRVLLRERAAWTLCLAGVMVLLLGGTRVGDNSGPLVIKYGWTGCADVVVTGDSRTGKGVSPSRMKQCLQGLRIANYAFDGNGYSGEYLTAIENVLDPHSTNKMIILGISPQSLTEVMATRNSFLQARQNYSYSSVVVAQSFHKLLRFTGPLKFNELFGGVFVPPAQRRKYHQSFPDGWDSVYYVPPLRDFNSYLRDAVNIFDNNPVSPRIVADLLHRITLWRRCGIRVYAFRPPTIREMVEIENSHGGFEEQKFIAAFEKAGGRWLNVDQFRYDSLDGCHLNRTGALQFSRDMALMIVVEEKITREPLELATRPQSDAY
jgi:hypothetical protein